MTAPASLDGRDLPGFVWRAVTSSLGAKMLMAVTGILLYGFLLAHLAGNLLMYGGPQAMNDYSHFLKSTPELLWPLRLGLLSAFAIHVLSAARLVNLQAAARPEGYQVKRWRQASWASRTMFWVSGITVLAFIFFHLFHFTMGWVQPEFFARETLLRHADVFAMVVHGFQAWWVDALYTVGMLAVGLHLWHGVWSSTQTLGLNGPRWTPFMKAFSVVFAVVLVSLFLSIVWTVRAGGISLP